MLFHLVSVSYCNCSVALGGTTSSATAGSPFLSFCNCSWALGDTTSSATIVVVVLFGWGVSVPFLSVLASPLALCVVLYVLV